MAGPFRLTSLFNLQGWKASRQLVWFNIYLKTMLVQLIRFHRANDAERKPQGWLYSINLANKALYLTTII